MTQKVSEEIIVEKLKTIFDPEIPVNIYDLGLIYKIDIDDNNEVEVLMTLNCA
jgi:metal-sulfur cluster biosynthetic enzyme